MAWNLDPLSQKKARGPGALTPSLVTCHGKLTFIPNSHVATCTS